jgi:hypothetical protein
MTFVKLFHLVCVAETTFSETFFLLNDFMKLVFEDLEFSLQPGKQQKENRCLKKPMWVSRV